MSNVNACIPQALICLPRNTTQLLKRLYREQCDRVMNTIPVMEVYIQEEERLEDYLRVLTVVSGRKKGSDLETVSSQWQPEAQPGKNSADLLEQEQTL
ncbi:hypothetical protein NDU88_002926 [Pleurodeles waltl]|uniref:Uncharacterized protein n=1 Tax=Pleurodeles waltl TaxID=8319 RepID=A0AAV7T3A4_PLEWA|nr:hypothetical protein NDU88_002926 [Pleurodeles waltl]